ncbi:hypothetical protein Bca52824_037181 [Brassica carinata]|uniref:F-box associated beta-propeller type 3 domain-containing protein n=1 Tax=Brassica carinata TaxID=52824 RepID=A0A8X7S5B3_BRACI|nr:hypothetical protein Bca52824_037181 [Brassica carinata]
MRVICNPATGEFLTLPNVLKENILPNGNPAVIAATYLGYDRIGKRFKVLRMTSSRDGRSNTRQVLTLESGKLLWRMVECKFHFVPTLALATRIYEKMVRHIKFVGVTGRGEIVYSPRPFHPVNRYFVVFYNVESKTFRRVKVEGLEVEEGEKNHFKNTLIGYVENLEFM